MGIMGFIVLTAVVVGLNRMFAWRKRADRLHRERLAQRGYTENNGPRRVRKERYSLIGWIAFEVCGILIMWLWPGGQYLKYAGFWYVLPQILAAIVFSMLAAIAVNLLVTEYFEATLPSGDRALLIRDKQWHRNPEAVVPGGQHGTAYVQPASRVAAFGGYAVVHMADPMLSEDGGL